MDTNACPKCGAALPIGRGLYDCGSPVQPDALVRPDQSKECLRRQLAAVTAERDALDDAATIGRALMRGLKADNSRLREALDKLLNKVNAVTAPHRHGIPVTRNALDNLANRQIEVESLIARAALAHGEKEKP